jgi:hypothetical protein
MPEVEVATAVSHEDRTAPGWREGLEALYREAVQRYLAHPWVLDIPISGSPTMPSGAAWLDARLQVLADTPLTHLEQVPVALLVTGPGALVFVDQSDPFRFGMARSLDGVAYLESARGGHHDEPHPWTGLDDAGITEDRRVRAAKKAFAAAEKTLRDARRLKRLAAREARRGGVAAVAMLREGLTGPSPPEEQHR